MEEAKNVKYLILDASGIIECDRMGAIALADLSNELAQKDVKLFVAQARGILGSRLGKCIFSMFEKNVWS